MHLRHILRPLALFFGAFMIVIVTAASSACNHDQRTTTLHTALIAVDAAEIHFTAWDLQHQQEIVAGSATRDEAHARVAAYREARDALIKEFLETYQAIATAAAGKSDAELEAAIKASHALVDHIDHLTSAPTTGPPVPPRDAGSPDGGA